MNETKKILDRRTVLLKALNFAEPGTLDLEENPNNETFWTNKYFTSVEVELKPNSWLVIGPEPGPSESGVSLEDLSKAINYFILTHFHILSDSELTGDNS